MLVDAVLWSQHVKCGQKELEAEYEVMMTF